MKADVCDLPAGYVNWNARLLDYCTEECAGNGGLFSLVVRQMLDDQDVGEAEQAFVTAVANAYRSLSARAGDPLAQLAALHDKEGRPLCGAFLGVSVRAAEEMGNLNYYARLAGLLGCDQVRSGVSGFKHRSFQRCWESLALWVGNCGFSFPRPAPDEQTYIRWPKGHALLRRIDVEKLPAFFREYRYTPLRACSQRQVERDLTTWKAALTKQGQSAYQDAERRTGVIRQVLHALSQWEPSAPDSVRSREAKVLRSDAWLEWRAYGETTKLSLVAPRRPGFPDRVDGPLVTWSAADEEWYESVPVTGEVSLHLAAGFESGQSRRVRFQGAPAFVLSPSEYGSHYDSRGEEGLPLGGACAVLCRSGDQHRVASYLEQVCGEPVSASAVLSGVPLSLFRRVKAIRESDPPAGLDMLRVTNRLHVAFLGGLHTGKARTWLEGAPPTLVEVSGSFLPDSFTLNEVELPLADGRADIAALLEAPGTHLFRVGGEVRKLHIEPIRLRLLPPSSVPPRGLEQAEEAEPTARPFPPGAWTVIGPRSDNIRLPGSPAPVNFEQQWLIGRDEAGTTGKVALRELPLEPRRTGCRALPRAALRWADAVLAVDRGKLGAIAAGSNHEVLMGAWRAYATEARRIRSAQAQALRARREALDD